MQGHKWAMPVIIGYLCKPKTNKFAGISLASIHKNIKKHPAVPVNVCISIFFVYSSALLGSQKRCVFLYISVIVDDKVVKFKCKIIYELEKNVLVA